MQKIRKLATDHFECSCVATYAQYTLEILVEVFTDMSADDFFKASQDFYTVLSDAGYTNASHYITVKRGHNAKQLHPPTYTQ